MTRRSILWRVGAVLYTVINAGGAVFAARTGEPMHAMIHVALLTLGLGAYLVWRLGVRPQPDAANARVATERLNYLQQSVDAIALEVERIGEAQRFNEKLRAEREAISPPTKKEE